MHAHFTRPALLTLTAEQALRGGQARIRTLEDISQQIYSLPPLATWVPARDVSLINHTNCVAQIVSRSTKTHRPIRAQSSTSILNTD
jgi:hypothetical protein